MHVLEPLNILGMEAVGISALATDAYCLVAGQTKHAVIERLKEIYQVPVIPLNITIQKLIGVMFVGNRKGLLLPNHIDPFDAEKITSVMAETVPGIEVKILEQSRLNALGNLIAVNDRGATVSSRLPRDAIEMIEHVLDVETFQTDLNRSPLVGTRIVVNSRGCLVSPLASDEKLEIFKDLFHVDQADFTTVNLGMEAIRVGIVANSHGAVVGARTSGPEMARISDILEV